MTIDPTDVPLPDDFAFTPFAILLDILQLKESVNICYVKEKKVGFSVDNLK